MSTRLKQRAVKIWAAKAFAPSDGPSTVHAQMKAFFALLLWYTAGQTTNITANSSDDTLSLSYNDGKDWPTSGSTTPLDPRNFASYFALIDDETGFCADIDRLEQAITEEYDLNNWTVATATDSGEPGDPVAAKIKFGVAVAIVMNLFRKMTSKKMQDDPQHPIFASNPYDDDTSCFLDILQLIPSGPDTQKS